MSDGRFEKGRWVEETDSVSASCSSSDDLPERVAATRSSFGKGLDDLLAVGRDLFTTEEGRRHIGRQMDKAGEEMMKTLEETARTATEYISSLMDPKRRD